MINAVSVRIASINVRHTADTGGSSEWLVTAEVCGQRQRQRFDGVVDGSVLPTNMRFVVPPQYLERLPIRISGEEIDDTSDNDLLPSAQFEFSPKVPWVESSEFTACTFSSDRTEDFEYSVRVEISPLGREPNALPWFGLPHKLMARHSGKYMDVGGLGDHKANGDKLQQWEAAGGLNQQFYFHPVGDDAYVITARHSGRVLDVAGGEVATANGVAVQQWDYLGGRNQRWHLLPVAGEFFYIVAAHSGLCLDVSGGESHVENGVPVQQWEVWGGRNQQWKLIPWGGWL